MDARIQQLCFGLCIFGKDMKTIGSFFFNCYQVSLLRNLAI
ncbi:MAG: hypothetical protein ACI8SE_001645, partial [Bacteroidia bacterium]